MERRRARLDEAHVRSLADYAAEVRSSFGEAPDPDPADGGVEAAVLILLETPGPTIRATGLVSADNPTGTGANLRRFCAEAGLARTDRLIWNVVPWVIHVPGARNRPPARAELEAGRALLPSFLKLLPKLRSAVLLGRSAASARSAIEAVRPELKVLEAPHPSPTYVCTHPSIGPRITAALAAAAAEVRPAADNGSS